MEAMSFDGQFQSWQTVVVPKRSHSTMRKLLIIFFVLLLPLGWQFASRSWDEYVAYSGTVIKKEMRYDYLRSSRGPWMNLYVVVQDQQGKISTRYVGNDWSGGSRWLDIQVGSFVVKNKGFREYPKPLGASLPGASPQTEAWTAMDWILLGCFLMTAILFLRGLRQLWDLL